MDEWAGGVECCSGLSGLERGAVFNRLASEPYNLAVVSYDAFSFGKSTTFADHRGHVDEFDFLVDDMQEVLKVAKTRYPNKPVILCGHSLGGLIATRTVLRDQSAVAALVLSSAAMDVVRNLALKILGPISGVAAWLLPMARIAPAVDPKDLSVDKQVAHRTSTPTRDLNTALTMMIRGS